MAKRSKKDLEARHRTDSNLIIYNSDGTLKGKFVNGEWKPKKKPKEKK